MSSFGIRAFKRLKEKSITEDKKHYFDHIVFGNDFLAIWLYLKLRKEHGKENVCLICESWIDKVRLLDLWKCTINTLRNEDAANTLIGACPQLEITPSNTKVQFYKDTKFHEFGKRAKSLPLQPGEEKFLNPYFNVNYQNLFSIEDWQALDEVLKDQVNKYLNSIEITTPSDLVEKTHFKLHTGEHESFECETLHWIDNPKKFYKLIKEKSIIADSVGEYCTSLEQYPAVVVHFECDEIISEEAGTVFLPQSMTHEWGHFIVDFLAFDTETNTQVINGLILLKEDDLTEDELAKKIKLLKRVIERVYPDFAKTNYKEHIRFSEDMFISGMKDELKSKLNEELPNLNLGGIAAPSSNSKLFANSRAIVSLMN